MPEKEAAGAAANPAEREKTKDTLFAGKLACFQHTQGYRFSLDSVLLAHFPNIGAGTSILDLGCGCGIIGLILLYRYEKLGIRVTGYEKQSALVELARLNREVNGYHEVFRLLAGTAERIRAYLPPESFSLVVANPPFYRQATGRTTHNSEAMTARHQEGDTIGAFIAATAYCLENRGHASFIYPAESAPHLIRALSDKKLEPKRLQFVYAYPDLEATATLVLVDAVKNGGPGTKILPPCYIQQYKNGPYSERVQTMYQG